MISLSLNKKARLNYDISTVYTVGISLLGHETKACKMDHCSIAESIIRLDDKK